jgi:hypothetical protein
MERTESVTKTRHLTGKKISFIIFSLRKMAF